MGQSHEPVRGLLPAPLSLVPYPVTGPEGSQECKASPKVPGRDAIFGNLNPRDRSGSDATASHRVPIECRHGI